MMEGNINAGGAASKSVTTRMIAGAFFMVNAAYFLYCIFFNSTDIRNILYFAGYMLTAVGMFSGIPAISGGGFIISIIPTALNGIRFITYYSGIGSSAALTIILQIINYALLAVILLLLALSAFTRKFGIGIAAGVLSVLRILLYVGIIILYSAFNFNTLLSVLAVIAMTVGIFMMAVYLRQAEKEPARQQNPGYVRRPQGQPVIPQRPVMNQPPAEPDNIQKIVKLKELFDSGAITREEYEQKKQELLKRI